VPVVLLSTLEAAAAEGGVAGAGGAGTAGSILLHVARRVEALAAVPAPAPAALPDHCPPDHGSLVRVGSWGGGALEGGPAIGAVDHDADDDDMQPGGEEGVEVVAEEGPDEGRGLARASTMPSLSGAVGAQQIQLMGPQLLLRTARAGPALDSWLTRTRSRSSWLPAPPGVGDVRCSSCGEPVVTEQAARATHCGHRVCAKCLGAAVANRLAERRARPDSSAASSSSIGGCGGEEEREAECALSVGCPVGGCGQLLEPQEIVGLLPIDHPTLTRFLDLTLEQYLGAEAVRVHCPECATTFMMEPGAVGELTAEAGREIKATASTVEEAQAARADFARHRTRCPLCAVEFCAGCGVTPFHVGFASCEAAAAAADSCHCRFCTMPMPAPGRQNRRWCRSAVIKDDPVWASTVVLARSSQRASSVLQLLPEEGQAPNAWRSAGKKDQWLCFDLQSPLPVHRLRIARGSGNSSYAPRRFAIQQSVHGLNGPWLTISEHEAANRSGMQLFDAVQKPKMPPVELALGCRINVEGFGTAVITKVHKDKSVAVKYESGASDSHVEPALIGPHPDDIEDRSVHTEAITGLAAALFPTLVTTDEAIQLLDAMIVYILRRLEGMWEQHLSVIRAAPKDEETVLDMAGLQQPQDVQMDSGFLVAWLQSELPVPPSWWAEDGDGDGIPRARYLQAADVLGQALYVSKREVSMLASSLEEVMRQVIAGGGALALAHGTRLRRYDLRVAVEASPELCPLFSPPPPLPLPSPHVSAPPLPPPLPGKSRDLLAPPCCGAGHTMQISEYSEGGYRSGYVCDKCGKRSSRGHLAGSHRRWWCQPCSADICFECHPLPKLGLDASGATGSDEVALLNGLYTVHRYVEDASGQTRPVFTNAKGATVYFAECWKMACSSAKADVDQWICKADATVGDAPPGGEWKMADGAAALTPPRVAVVDQSVSKRGTHLDATREFEVIGEELKYDSVKGTYVQDGESDGVPSFRKGVEPYTITRRGGFWWIDYDHGGSPYYRVQSSAASPPLQGWTGEGCQGGRGGGGVPALTQDGQLVAAPVDPALPPWASAGEADILFTVEGAGYSGANGPWGVDPSEPERNGRPMYKRMAGMGRASMCWTNDKRGWMFFRCGDTNTSNDWPYSTGAEVEHERPPSDGWRAQERCGKEPLPRLRWLLDEVLPHDGVFTVHSCSMIEFNGVYRVCPQRLKRNGKPCYRKVNLADPSVQEKQTMNFNSGTWYMCLNHSGSWFCVQNSDEQPPASGWQRGSRAKRGTDPPQLTYGAVIELGGVAAPALEQDFWKDHVDGHGIHPGSDSPLPSRWWRILFHDNWGGAYMSVAHVHFDVTLPALSQICDAEDCVERSKRVCERVRDDCGHACTGVVGAPGYRCADVCPAACLVCAAEGVSHLQIETRRREQGSWREMQLVDGLSSYAQLQGKGVSSEDYCPLCWSEALGAAPTIELACGHHCHLHCIEEQIKHGFRGGPISFGFLACPTCRADVAHPLLEPLIRPHQKMRGRVRALAVTQLFRDNGGEEGGLAVAAAAGEAVEAYATRVYAFKLCNDCKSPFCTGLAECDAGADGGAEDDPEAVVICQGCAARTGSVEKCARHGTEGLMWKCRYCCDIATFECFSYAHFCNRVRRPLRPFRRPF
jgi:hypothetical protein